MWRGGGGGGARVVGANGDASAGHLHGQVVPLCRLRFPQRSSEFRGRQPFLRRPRPRPARIKDAATRLTRRHVLFRWKILSALPSLRVTCRCSAWPAGSVTTAAVQLDPLALVRIFTA